MAWLIRRVIASNPSRALWNFSTFSVVARHVFAVWLVRETMTSMISAMIVVETSNSMSVKAAEGTGVNFFCEQEYGQLRAICAQ